jgi:SnoaL-like protein
MRIAGACVLLIVLSVSVPGVQAVPGAGVAGADLKSIALSYLRAERARQVEGATEKDVDAALAFLTDTAVYEHPKAGARIEGKETMRRGMLGHLGSTRNPKDEVLSSIAGPGVVVLELRQSFEFQDEAGWKSRSFDSVKVLEFDGDRIRREIDYR